MSDARWLEILDDMNWAVEHFGRAGEIHREGGLEDAGLEGYNTGELLN